MEEEYTYPAEYLKLGRYLWNRINDSKLDDAKELEALCVITFKLTGIFDDDHYMRELSNWAADRRDTRDPWQEFGEGIKEEFPEFFNED